MSMDLTTSVNNYNTNQFRVIFNEWPNLTGKPLNQSVFNNNVRSITIPDINIPMLNTQIGHIQQYHPSPIGYRQLNKISVKFRVDDKLLNYYAAKCWIDGSRTGIRKENKNFPDDFLRYNRIETMEIQNMDNAENVVSKMLFKRVFLTDISNLTLQYGASENAEFTCTFVYEECDFETLVEKDLKDAL